MRAPSFGMRAWVVIGTGLLALLVVWIVGGWIWSPMAQTVHCADVRLMELLLRPDGPPPAPWIIEVWRDVTALGGFTVTGVALALAGAHLTLTGRPRLALYLVVIALVGTALIMLMKAGVARPRPAVVPFGPHVASASFPSAHAAKAALVYFSIVVVSWDRIRGRPARLVAAGAALLLTLAVGASRVVLGVHWPSDVIGGWIMGGIWTWATWLIMRYLRPRGILEP